MCGMFHHLGAICDAAKCQEMKVIPVLILSGTANSPKK